MMDHQNHTNLKGLVENSLRKRMILLHALIGMYTVELLQYVTRTQRPAFP